MFELEIILTILVTALVTALTTRHLMRVRYSVKLDKVKKLHHRKLRELEKDLKSQKAVSEQLRATAVKLEREALEALRNKPNTSSEN